MVYFISEQFWEQINWNIFKSNLKFTNMNTFI